jgi:hypothetical protein
MIKHYLGDGVYAQLRPDHSVILTTENGISITNTIVLEHETLWALDDYLTRLKKGELM